ncbi:hypothetical protein K2173_028395 [Erythroxylum novogranatense]|uniref:Ribosomal protein S9 n=1 Tax=Erythroxylum novogranatense TaxID=1862640 RepID=A0AAV8U201_9ROSI|nr:hypothetical protein K2173_028395 [Erythroxylum novogranatense]
MLSRLLPKPSRLRFISQLYSRTELYSLVPPRYPDFIFSSRPFSTNHNGDNNNSNSNKHRSDPNIWKLTETTGSLDDISEAPSREKESWVNEKYGGDDDGDVFKSAEKESGDVDNDWLTSSEDYKPWNLSEEKEIDNLFVVEDSDVRTESSVSVEVDRSREEKLLQQEEKELTAVIKGPNRAFGDLIAASGITDAMLDSLIALKDFEGIEGLPPLTEIEDIRYEKNTRKSEEIAKARVRQVDDKGRSYGTGRRKRSVARVWIQPGGGSFIVNDKQFDTYFPMLDHRASLLQPFSETKTLGLWDVNCTVKGGGVSGQVGAIQLGISRALQNWEPDLRPPLRNAGLLTRDPREVERKKPGKAKARKSFQWVKR